ncbi:aminotransferase class IV [Hydrogenothermus marinus]|uniref:4-amino-4-deoxychorismate lyase n=1 Tax=Hydrogenothermus marinus TaxID=133270 RepID=A0A3M0BLY8_9AQUI|nr:aminotransferase class IV [Hydrogenothermus marinus]RMA97606.1 4-amino-4-deoxychorismate lyase [Hydrogenothermus marinus]
MEEVITLNGKRFLNKKVLRTLMYGEGVFETFRYKGRLPKTIDKHYQRLVEGAKLLSIPAITKEDYIYYIEETVKNLEEKDLYIKTILTSQGNSYFPLLPEASNLLVIAKPFKPLEKKEVKLTVYPYKVHSSDPLLRIKSTSYARNILAKRYALEKGAFDSIFLNENDEITETSSANIFWIKDKHLYTPSLECGVLKGITRQIVLEQAVRKGLWFTEGRFKLEDLKSADFIFITNSLHGIIRVKSIIY